MVRKLVSKGEIMIENAEDLFWAYDTDDNYSNKDLILLDNVQFIYELSLAELELKSLGVEYEVTSGLREFKILNKTKEIVEKNKEKGFIL